MAKIKCSECGTSYKGDTCPHCSAPAPEGASKKKRKWLLPVIIGVLLIILIATAGGDEDVEQPSDVHGDSSVQETTGNTQAPDGTEAPDATDATDATDAPTEPEPPAAQDITIAETELYNENDIIVTATAFKDSLFGPEISVTITNNSKQNVTISSHDLSVNGYMLSGSGLYSDIAAGKSALETMTLLGSELSEAGIETVADIEFTLNIFDSDTYDDIDNSGLIKLSTSAAEGFTQPIDDSGDVIYDANGVRVICKGLKDDFIWDGCIVFYFENNSDKYVSVYGENVSVNDFMVDEFLWSDLRAGTRSIEGMYLLTLDEIGLESVDAVENIEFTLKIIDDDWDEIDTTDVITLTFG